MAQLVEMKPAPRAVDMTHRDLSWFSQRVERGRKEPFAEIVTITPDIAKRILDNNANNRSMSSALVTAIAHDIARGRWRMNGETIIISEDGELNDGQNRLLAVVKSGLPVQSVIMFGVSRSSRLTVDMGRARSAAQFLAMLGTANASKISGIARLQLVFESGMVNGARSATKQDHLRLFEERRDDVLVAYKHVGATRFAASISGAAYLPVAYMNIHAIDSIHCDLFFEALATGAGLDQTDPVLWLRAKLFETMNKRLGLRAEDRLEMTLRYWNAWADQKALTLALKMSGAYPKIQAAKSRI